MLARLFRFSPLLWFVWLFAAAIIALNIFRKSNGGYKRCWKCFKKLSWIHLNFVNTPFCSKRCKASYDLEMLHEGLLRLEGTPK